MYIYIHICICYGYLVSRILSITDEKHYDYAQVTKAKQHKEDTMNDMILPIGIFALSMCITPGPNNMMLTASGANFGFRRTIPHILGVEIGLLSMIALSGLGLGILFRSFPVFHQVLKYASILYLLYLSVRIALSQKAESTNQKGLGPLSIFQAAAFQIINPKVLVMATTSISTFSISGSGYMLSVMMIVAIFGMVCIPAISVWAGFGTMIGKKLTSRTSFRIFNVVMGLLTASSVLFMI